MFADPPDIPESPHERGWAARRWAGVRAAAFPGALLLFATFFLGGRIGFWSDDYWHNLRGPTGELPALTFAGLTMDRGFFLRPLFYWIVPGVTTLAWKTQWPAHLLLTASHGLVVLLLWRLMRTLGISARGAAAASLLFMVYPASFEALFWTAALPTSIATALMLRLMTVYAQYAQREGAFAASGARELVSVAVMPALTFEVCCLNEQPAMGVLALPLVYWAARAAAQRDRPRHAIGEWARALLPAALCGLAVLAYAAMVVLDPHKPAGSRGSAEQFVALHEVPERAVHFGNVLWRRLALWNFGPGAWRLGWRTIAGEGWSGWARPGVAMLAATLWLRRWVRGRVDTDSRETRDGLWRAACLGGAVFITGWLPILMMAVYEPDSRTRYWPATGMALIAAAGFTALERQVRARASGWPRTWLRITTGAGLVAGLLALAVMLVGIQGAFRWRWELDRQQGWELRGELPEPTPYTFFVPLWVANTGVWTGSPVLDSHFRSVWEFPWTAPRFLRAAYGRADLHCGYWRHWTPRRPVIGADERGILFTDVLGPRFPRDGAGSRIPWTLAAPFVVNGDGMAVLVTRVIIVDPDGRETAIKVPQASKVEGWVRRSGVTARLPRS